MNRQKKASDILVCLRPAAGTLLLCCALFTFSCNNKTAERTISDKLTLAGDSKIPMGAYVFRQLATKAFSNDTVTGNIIPFQKWHQRFLNENYNTSNNAYFIVTPRLITHKEEALAMKAFVSNGNTLFIAANYFDPDFLEQFSVSLQDDLSILSVDAAFKMRDTKKYLADSTLFNPSQFSFYFYPLQKSLLADTTLQVEVIGRNDFGSADMLRILYGKGQLIITTNVQTFTNYFLLTGNNYEYASGALSYFPAEVSNVYWDDFYRKNTSRAAEGKSIFSALLSVPELRFTFWIMIAIALLWLATNIRRRQRVIPVEQPNVNSSADFTQTIARLYFNKKDNHNIALKMIAYLQDHLRNKYYMNYSGINETFAQSLAAKTGIAPRRIEQLVDNIHTVQHNSTIDDITLLQLNEQIQEVMKVGHSPQKASS